MTSCDTNILVCAYNASSKEHVKALRFLAENLTNGDFAISELILVEFYVLLRNPAIFPNALNSKEAASLVHELRSNRYWTVLKGTSDVSDLIWAACATTDLPRRAIFDARIAYSLAAEGVTRFATRNTSDFMRFGAFELFNPID